MRTKVEKRRVRHEPPGDLINSSGASHPSGHGGAGLNSLAPVVLSSTSVLAGGGEKRDSDRRPVSLSEAERLAVANHVVVALGPPVVVGPRGVLESKGDGVGLNLTASSAGQGGHRSSGDSSAVSVVAAASAAHEAQKKVDRVSPAIKKPPKKRRNNEKKGDLVVDMVQNVVAPVVEQVPGSTEVQLPPAPTTVLLPQLQQPPMTPPTPSPQHPASLSPPQHPTHLAAKTSQSPHHPPPPTRIPPQQPISMVSADHAEMANSIIEGHPAAVQQADVQTTVNMVHQFEAEKVPVADMDGVLPSLQTPFSQAYPLVQSGLVQTVADTYSGESSLPASTSLLQPPTWLLTPQETPGAADGNSASDHMAASEPMRAEADCHNSIDLSPLLTASRSSVTSTIHLNPKGSSVNKKTSTKLGPSKSNTSLSGEGGSKKKKVKSVSKKGNIKGSSVSENTISATSEANGETATDDKVEDVDSVSEDAKPKSKPKKPPKLPLDENVERRIANIEETIDSVIANYVYNCDDLSKLNGLRQAQREVEAKEAEEEAKAKAERAKAASSSAKANTKPQSTATVSPSDSQTEASGEMKNKDHRPQLPTSQQDGSIKPESVVEVPRCDSQQSMNTGESSSTEPSVVKKKPAAKKSKKKAEASTNSCKNVPVQGEGEAVQPAKKKTPKKKKKKDDAPAKTDEGKVSGSDQSEKTSERTKEDTEDAQPSPPKKKKKASKKKDAAGSSEQVLAAAESSSSVIPNGHIESTSTEDSPKAPKKKKSKPKAKKTVADPSKSADTGASAESGVSAGETAKTEGSGEPRNSAAQSAGTDVLMTPVKPAKSKPKKAKKRKSDTVQGSEGGENGEAGEMEKDGEAEKKDGDLSKPSPKKKKKKQEGNTGDSMQTQPKKKKSPSKSKKTKKLQSSSSDGAETANTDSSVQQNGLPHSNDGSSDANITDSKSSEIEAGTMTDGLSENDGSLLAGASFLEKKVKKTLDIVSCQECGHKTRGQAALSRHMKKMHEKSISLPYPCPQEACEYSASKVSLLARHMLTHRLYMCSRCQFTVDTKDQYEDHLQVVHNVKLDCKLCKRCNRYIKCDTMPLDKHLEMCQGPIPFTCDVCNKEFKYESSLKVHHHSHFPDQPKLFHCAQCDYSSNYRANLHKHVQNMHTQRPKDIKCLTCDKMFSTEDNMRRHMKIHTQVRPHKCERCDKAFKSACALKGHLVCHELARPYQCNIDNCNREFRTPKFLKSHQEEFHRLIPKKYHCPMEGCSFSFFKLSHLKRHEVSHTGERNFHCEWPGCGKSFRHSDNLKVHQRQHTDERPVSCPHCAFTCRQKSSLQWHIRKMHKQMASMSSSPDNSTNDAISLSSMKSPEEMDTTPAISEGAEVVVEGVSGVSVNIVIGEGGEVPVTITEIRPVDLYEFHSDNDSSDEATPGVFKRNKSKMASAAPLPPPPKELLMKNSVLDVLDTENNQVEVVDGKLKPKKKKPSGKKTKAAKQNGDEDGEKKENEAGSLEDGKDSSRTTEKKIPSESKKKKSSSLSKSKKKKVESKENAAENKGPTDNEEVKDNEEGKDEEAAAVDKTPPKKKSPAKKKMPTKRSLKETSAVAEKPVKTKAPAKGKKSPKTRSSPKKTSSPKGKLAKPATRKTPPRKAAAKKVVKATTKKSPAKKAASKKKTPVKKKAPPKKKAAAKKSKEKQEELEPEAEEEAEPETQERSRSRKKSQARASKEKWSRVEEEVASPARPESLAESEEENMPQGKGSPYREFDSQDMDESSPEPRESPSPPASPTPGDLLQKSPTSDDENVNKETEEMGDEAANPAESQEEAEQPDAESSDGEVINDIPLTPPRAPAPPPPESSDEEEMVPSPPAHMSTSADTSDTAAPSSVLTDVQQPGSQAPDFQQPHSREEFQQPHSREEFQQPHSREEFQQPMSQQPLSREDYPQIHSREEILQPHSREEYPQPHSREEYPQPHSISQPHSREEYPQPHSREDYPQLHSREELHQQHSREELQPQGSIPEQVSEHVPSVHSDGMHEDVSMPHSVVQYDPSASPPVPVSEAESAYQYLQGLAQSGESMPEPLSGEPTRLQQLEALAEKPMDDRSTADMTVKSPVAAPTSVITSMSPVGSNALVMGPADMSSHRRMEILSSDRGVEQALGRDTSSVLPRLPDAATYDAYSALNPLTAGATRDNNNLFPAPPGTPGFMRLTESEAMLQRQRMTTPFLPTPQPADRSLSRLPESSLRPPNPSTLLRRPATMAGADMFPAASGMPQAMQRNPFTNSWPGQDVRPTHWSQAPTYLQRPPNTPTTPFPFATKDNYLAGREFMFDPTVRPGVTDRNMFASLSSSQTSASETNPFPLERFDLSMYFGSHPYSGASGLDYSRTACGTTSKTFDERYRQTAASMTDFRPLPPTTSADMFSGIGVGVNSLNSASFNLDKYAMYGRDPMYHAAAQQLSDNTNSAFLTHATPSQHSVFDRDYAARSLYTQNPAYAFTGHTPTATMGQERDFMSRSTTNENQMQDPYRCGMLYNVTNRYTFE